MRIPSLILISLVISACSSGDSNADADRDETVGAEIANDYNRQMQRARDVELQLDAQKRDLDAAIEASDQPRRDP